MAIDSKLSSNATEGELDIKVQFDNLRSLKNGWYVGDGLALSHGGLDWLDTQFAAEYPDALPRP